MRAAATAALVALAAAAVGTAMGAVVLVAGGARAWVIESPSMGAAAPVGSLVVTTPVPLAALHEGDVVAFQPPGDDTTVHMHRVTRYTDGQLWTRGDLNAAHDPWPLTSSTLIGRAALVLPAAGFVLRALPLLVLTALVIGVGAPLLPAGYRGPARVAVGSAALLAITALVHPWTGATPVPSSTGRSIDVVSTGLLPQHVDVVTADARHPVLVGQLDLTYGQVATIAAADRFAGTPLRLRVRPSFAALGP